MCVFRYGLHLCRLTGKPFTQPAVHFTDHAHYRTFLQETDTTRTCETNLKCGSRTQLSGSCGTPIPSFPAGATFCMPNSHQDHLRLTDCTQSAACVFCSQCRGNFNCGPYLRFSPCDQDLTKRTKKEILRCSKEDGIYPFTRGLSPGTPLTLNIK